MKKKLAKSSILVSLFAWTVATYAQHVVRYDLHIRDTIVNYTGKSKKAIAVNGSIPMPTLIFTEGDTAEIIVHNERKERSTLHWHGLLLPNKEDGVPYLTQLPIKAGSTYVYRFPIIQNGTHWYHSHYQLQEQIGMYGSLIINKRLTDSFFRKGIDDLPSIPIILSEWSDYNPKNIHRLLHNATDWFAIKKGTTQSYWEALRQGYLGTKLKNEWKRMNAMDVSDVYYDKIFINGRSEAQLTKFVGGDKVRLQISNGGASTNFWLTYGGGKITVVANDGNDVTPVEVDRLLIAVSETYDVIVTIPQDHMAYEFLVSAEDRIKSASLYLGNGPIQLDYPLAKLKYFDGMKMMNNMMKLNGNLQDMGMHMSLNQMDMNTVMYPEITGTHLKSNRTANIQTLDSALSQQSAASITTLNYSMLRSTHSTTYPFVATRTFQFNLTGNMNRYVWSMDNKVISETDKLLIRKGENIRVIIYNNSMMRHPMHLHGHDFRLINGQGDYAPLKNVVDIMPMETDTLEFKANVEGDWFFHCHILYHMMSGMGRIFSYQNQLPNPQLKNSSFVQRKLFADDRRYHLMLKVGIESNGSDGELMIASTRYFLQTEWRVGINLHHGFESESHIGRYFGKNQFFRAYIGWDFRYRKMLSAERNIFGQFNTKNLRQVACIGFQYTLPMLIIFDARLDHTGRFRFQLMREDIPLTNRLRLSFMINTDKEYMVGLRFIVLKNISLSTHYDSDMGWGAGFVVNY